MIVSLFLLASYLVSPARIPLLAKDFPFDPHFLSDDPTDWYGSGPDPTKPLCSPDPPIPQYTNNWGNSACPGVVLLPPHVPSPIDDVMLGEHNVVLRGLADVRNLTVGDDDGNGSFTIEDSGILGVVNMMEAKAPVFVEGLLSGNMLHHTALLRIENGGAVDAQTLNSDGTVHIKNGSLSVNSSYQVKNGKTLLFEGGLLVPDQLEVLGGAAFNWISGELLTSSANFIAGSNVTIGDTDSGTMNISNLNGGTLNNSTTVEFQGGQWWINAGATVNNQGTLQLVGTNPLIDSTTEAAGTIENHGTVQSTASMARIFRTRLNNHNLVQVDSGQLDIAGGGTSMGTFDEDGNLLQPARFQIAAGAELLFGGPTFNSFYPPYVLKNGASISGGGFARVITNLSVAAGESASAENLQVEGILAAGVGATMQISDTLRFTNGFIIGGTTRILPGAELQIDDGTAGADTSKIFDVTMLDNQGLAKWTGEGELLINGGSVFHNASGATFRIENATIMDTTSQAAGTFDNLGTVLKTSGGTSRINRTHFDNRGTVQVNSGILDIAGGGTSDSTFEIAPGAELKFGTNFPTQVYTLAGGSEFTGAGLLHVTGAVAVASGATVPAEQLHLEGQLVGPGTLTVSNLMNWTAGTQTNGRTIIQAGADMTIDGAADKTLTGHVVENHGTTTWLGTGRLIINAGADFQNVSGESFIVANNAEMDTTSQAGATFTNQGTFRKTSGGVSRINRTGFHNQGLVQVEAGTLELAGGGTSTGQFSLSGGAAVQLSFYMLETGTQFIGDGTARVAGNVTLAAPHTVSADNFELLSGLVSGGGTLEINNQLDWLGGVFSGGTTTVKSAAMLDVSSDADKTLGGGHTLDLFGTGTWTGAGSLFVNSGSRLRIRPGATFDIQNDAPVDSSSFPAGSVDVEGLLRKSNSGGTTRFFRTQLNNLATVHVGSGILRLEGGGLSSGAFAIDAGAALELVTYTLGMGTAITGGGIARIAGNVSIPAGANVPASRVDLVSGALFGPATLTINNELRLDGSANKVFDTLTLQNNGTATWTGTAQLLLRNSAVFNNNGAGMFFAENDSTVDTDDFPAGVFNNHGTWIKRNSAGTTRFFRTPIHNLGLVDIQSGTLRLESGGNHSGSFQMAGGTSLQLAAGLHTLSGGSQFGGAGLLRLNGATAQIPAAAAVSTHNADLSAGALNVDGQLAINGTFNWTGGGLSINNAGSVANNSTNTFNASVSATVAHSGAATSRFQNVGAFHKTAATGTTRFAPGVAFDNSGTTNVGTGSTLQLSGGGTSTAPFHVSAGGVLLFDITPYTWAGGTVIDGAGVARISGTVQTPAGATVPVERLEILFGTLSGTGTVQVQNQLTWTSGTLANGTLVVEPGATATINGAAFGQTLNGNTYVNRGTTMWSAGTITATNSPTVSNHAGAVFELTSNAGLSGAGNFNNAGLLQKTAGTGTSFFGLATSNTGTVRATSGTLQFSGGFSQLAGRSLLDGGNLGSSTPMNFFGGALEGNGTVGGQVNNLGAVVSPGFSPGAIRIAGSYSQGPDGQLAIEIAGTNPNQFDRLEITIGTAMLNGTLDVSLIGGFVPQAGDMFRVLTAAGGVSGTFSAANLPAVASGTGLTWNVDYNFGDVTLEVLAALAGDYNGDRTVNAADYVVWRKTDGSQAGYDLWRTNFGRMAGSGSGATAGAPSGSSAAVPEPTSLLMVLTALLAGVIGRRPVSAAGR